MFFNNLKCAHHNIKKISGSSLFVKKHNNSFSKNLLISRRRYLNKIFMFSTKMKQQYNGQLPLGGVNGALFLERYSMLFLRHGSKEQALILYFKIIRFLKMLLRCNFTLIVNRIFFYARLSFYNKIFTKSGRQVFHPLFAPHFSQQNVFFSMFKKALSERKEKHLYERMLFEICESGLALDSVQFNLVKRNIQDAISTRMKIHWKERW